MRSLVHPCRLTSLTERESLGEGLGVPTEGLCLVPVGVLPAPTRPAVVPVAAPVVTGVEVAVEDRVVLQIVPGRLRRPRGVRRVGTRGVVGVTHRVQVLVVSAMVQVRVSLWRVTLDIVVVGSFERRGLSRPRGRWWVAPRVVTASGHLARMTETERVRRRLGWGRFWVLIPFGAGQLRLETRVRFQTLLLTRVVPNEDHIRDTGG